MSERVLRGILNYGTIASLLVFAGLSVNSLMQVKSYCLGSGKPTDHYCKAGAAK